MAIFNIANQLLQIDTGKTRTFLYNKSLSPIQVYADIGEVQTPGQRYVGVANATAANPFGAPAYFMLVNYKSTGNPAPAAAPAPIYWTDTTFTTVSGVQAEGWATTQSVAGYLMLNTTDLPTLTAAMLNGAQCIIQVGGYLVGALAPQTGAAAVAGNWITGAQAGSNFTSFGVAAGTAPGYRPLGIATSAVSGGLCNVLVLSDII